MWTWEDIKLVSEKKKNGKENNKRLGKFNVFTGRRLKDLKLKFDTIVEKYDTLVGKNDVIVEKHENLILKYDLLFGKYEALENRFDEIETKQEETHKCNKCD